MKSTDQLMLQASCISLRTVLGIAPYQAQHFNAEDDDLMASKVRIMGVAYSNNRFVLPGLQCNIAHLTS